MQHSEFNNLMHYCKSDEEKIEKLLSHRLTKNINEIHEEQLTFGEKAADVLTAFCGSWAFIISFMVFLLIWIFINTWFMIHPFDVYPYVLLNLIFGILSTLESPIIMMSQNRQAKKDKIRSENEYQINMKAEILTENIYKDIEEIKTKINQ